MAAARFILKDAERESISRIPANPNRVFINYGSSLKRENDIYFSSLSKLNAIFNPGDASMSMTVNGQPRINLKVKSKARNVSVNGKKYDSKPVKGNFTIKIHNKK